MVLKGIDDIDWFTDRPDRVAGEWSTKTLVKKWDGLFGGVEPNAQATFEIGSKRKLVTFEMFKPKLSDSNQTLSFKVRGIGEKNNDSLTGLKNERLSDASLFIDDATYQGNNLTSCFPNCKGENLVGVKVESDLSGGDFTGANLVTMTAEDANLTNANLSYANLSGSDLTKANLTGANLTGSNLYNGYIDETNLSNANMQYATLNYAYGYKANLSGADLTSANLKNANLTNANLSNANLTEANLTGANIYGADLSGVTWSGTICFDGNLQTAAGCLFNESNGVGWST